MPVRTELENSIDLEYTENKCTIGPKVVNFGDPRGATDYTWAYGRDEANLEESLIPRPGITNFDQVTSICWTSEGGILFDLDRLDTGFIITAFKTIQDTP